MTIERLVLVNKIIIKYMFLSCLAEIIKYIIIFYKKIRFNFIGLIVRNRARFKKQMLYFQVMRYNTFE